VFLLDKAGCTWDLLLGKAAEKLRVNPRKSWYRNLGSVTTNGGYEATLQLKRPQPSFIALQFRYTNVWAENDLLVWDHLGTLHRAIADYGPEEIRLIRRCQVMATKVFDPEFLRPAHAMATAGAV
jgi:hypothetical protein